MNRDSTLYDLLHFWLQDTGHDYIDPYEVVEDRIPTTPERLRAAVDELDTWMATTTPQQRYDEIDQNDWMPFDDDEVDPFLEALRRRLVSGLEDAIPTPLAAPAGFLDHRDRAEGPYPELLRLARYMEAHVSGQSTNAFLSEEGNRDVVTVTTMRLHELAEMYLPRFLDELERLRHDTSSASERRETLGGAVVWDPSSEVDYWLEIVELCVRHRAQHGHSPREFTPEALEELRQNARLWPPVEASRSWCAELLYPWRDGDPYPAVEEVLARYDAGQLRTALEELDALLALDVAQRRRIVEVLLTEVPKRPPLDELLGEVRERVVAALATM